MRRTVFQLISINEDDTYTSIGELSHASAIKCPGGLYISLGSATESCHKSTNMPQSSPLDPHPRVNKWVGYATKHGVAYILTQESLRTILKSSKNDASASSWIVVRNARPVRYKFWQKFRKTEGFVNNDQFVLHTVKDRIKEVKRVRHIP